MKEKVLTPRLVVDISEIPGLDGISYDKETGLTIGATATHFQIESSALVGDNFPSLRDAFHTIGNIRIRCAGTIGGNLAYAEPQCNPPAILAALQGQVHVMGPQGERAIPAEDFVRGIFESALEPMEIITRVTVPPPRPRSASCFHKFTTRSETDKPTAVVATYVQLDPSMKEVEDCRIVVGAVGPKTYRCFRAEEAVKSSGGTEKISFEQAAATAASEFEVIEDANGPEWYKRQVTSVIIRDLLKKTVEQAKTGRYEP